MKLLIIFFVMVLSILAEPSQEPSDLTLLRNTWITSKAIAIKPLDDKYAASLSAMRDKYTKAGNLEAAIFVDNELKALLGKAPLQTKISNDPSQSTKDTEAIFGQWKWEGNSAPHIFRKDHTAQHGANTGKWEVKDSMFTILWSNGFRGTIELGQRGNTIKMHAYPPDSGVPFIIILKKIN